MANALPLKEHASFWYELQEYSDWLPLDWLEAEVALWAQTPSALRSLSKWGTFLIRYGGDALLAEIVVFCLDELF